jgi:alkylation response protein AidB-like acyl-CoA dehydrogenase
LDQFAFDYLRAQLPIEDVGAGAGAAGAAQRAWDARARLARTMPMATLEALMPELATLHADVEAARDAAESEGAHELSARLAAQLDRAAAVAALVHNDVRAARAELACCTLLHEVAIPISATGKLLLGALALAAVAAAALRSPWVGRNKLGSLARARNDRDR